MHLPSTSKKKSLLQFIFKKLLVTVTGVDPGTFRVKALWAYIIIILFGCDERRYHFKNGKMKYSVVVLLIYNKNVLIK